MPRYLGKRRQEAWATETASGYLLLHHSMAFESKYCLHVGYERISCSAN
jgi:hypothetical protein